MGVKCRGRRSEEARLRLPGDLPLQGGRRVAGEDLVGRTSVDEAEASGGGSCSVTPLPAAVASAILGTVARPPRLPALLSLSVFFAPQLPETDFRRPEGGQSALEGPRVGNVKSREKPGSWVAGRTRAGGRAPDGNGAGRARPPSAASLPPQSRPGSLGWRDCE